MEKNIMPGKRPPLTPRRKALRLEWAEKYIKTDRDWLYSLIKREQLLMGLVDGWEEGGSQTTKSVFVCVVNRAE